MTSSKTTVAIITARGGSKRIPRKNIRPFRGKPMLVWAIEAAQKSGAFDEVMVSTDDQEIADVARAAGAVVPFIRSAATSDDYSTTADVLLEVLDSYAKIGRTFDMACCLYPCSPLVTPDDLLNGRDEMIAGGFDVFFPLCAFSFPIWRSMKRTEDGRFLMNFPENLNERSQDLPPAYHDAGQWYWFDTETFLRTKVLMGENTGGVVLSEMRVQDIDSQEDWDLAELKHEKVFG